MSPSTFAPLQVLDDPLIRQAGIELSVLRLDNMPSPIPGNKYFKLKLNIEQAKSEGYKQLLSFGGAYSNHIHALALAGKHYGIATIGFIRGDQPARLNPTLQDAVDAGMQLYFVNRAEYRQRNDVEYLEELQRCYSDAYIIPEGGSNLLGVKGCMEIVDHIQHHLLDGYDVITVPCGTAATLAGIAAEAGDSKRVIGFSVLKNAHYLNDEVLGFLAGLGRTKKTNWQIQHDFHCGGYAKVSAALAEFMQWFQANHSIPVEPIYSGKMFYGFYQLLQESSSILPRGSRVVAIHTGGLQGLRGMEKTLQRLQTTVKE